MLTVLNHATTSFSLALSGWPSQPLPADSSPCIRYCYEGGTLKRDGRLLPVVGDTVHGGSALAALRDDGADLKRFTPRVYDPARSAWAPLLEDTQFDTNASSRVDVQLFRDREAEERGGKTSEGFFTIGVVGLKSTHNLGTLWRSAYQMGAASIFVVGDRYSPQTSDTVKAWRHVPLVSHADWNAFAAASPFGAVWVACEMGGEPLETFEHPERAVYLLGSEDSGLPESVLKASHLSVEIPSVRYESFNVAVAGSVLMYDRLAKQRRTQAGRKSPEAEGPATDSAHAY
jgi:tRNA(Leu) C34 or U34 (ribose-2'-O)-methylase TrmL|eukprot:jgi/Chrpa1/4622/Chrysochromulina_OHIO_Genome00018041-RA